MSNLMTAPKRLLERLENELAQEREADRIQAAQELAERETELAEVIPPLAVLVADADAELQRITTKAQAEILAAQKRLDAVRFEKQSKSYAIEHRIDTLRARLVTDLQHPAIADAMGTIEELHDSNRAWREDDDTATRSRTVAWCRAAQEQLTALQFCTEPDIAKRVDEIMASAPA